MGVGVWLVPEDGVGVAREYVSSTGEKGAQTHRRVAAATWASSGGGDGGAIIRTPHPTPGQYHGRRRPRLGGGDGGSEVTFRFWGAARGPAGPHGYVPRARATLRFRDAGRRGFRQNAPKSGRGAPCFGHRTAARGFDARTSSEDI